MRELRIKILKVNRKKIEKKLMALGAIKICEGEVCSSFFDFINKKDHREDSMLSVRRIGEKTIITVKKRSPKSASQLREEYQISTSDFHETKKIVKSLGLKEIESTRFYRTVYSLRDLTFKFDKYRDKYEYIPEFLEIQANDLDMIHEYAKILGLSKEECLPISTVELFKKYKKG